MSCNGCRVLRKGCSESCILRPCLQWIETPEAQGHATVFVAKFFGRAGLMSFISNVPVNQRPALFRSLLYESCGRTVNPVNGAVGLLWTGNWHICQAAVDTVLRGGSLRPIPELLNGTLDNEDESSEVVCLNSVNNNNSKRKRFDNRSTPKFQQPDLSLLPFAVTSTPVVHQSGFDSSNLRVAEMGEKNERRPGTPSLNSEESGTTFSFESGLCGDQRASAITVAEGPKLLNLFI